MLEQLGSGAKFLMEDIKLAVVCVEVLGQPNRGHVEVVSLPNHTFTGQTKSSKPLPVLCTFFPQKLTTALLESGVGKEWSQKTFHGQSPRKNAADPLGLNPLPPDYQSDMHPTELSRLAK